MYFKIQLKNRKLKISEIMTAKNPSISLRNLSERKEFARMIKNSNFLIENGQKGYFHSKDITPYLPTLKELI